MPTRLFLVLALGCGCGDKGPLAPANLPVSFEEARAIALAAVPGRIEHEELDFEDNRWLYELEIQPVTGPKLEVDIDAKSGTVVTVKPDD